MRLRIARLPAAVLVGLGVLNAWLTMILLRGEEIGVSALPASVAPSPNLSKDASGLATVKPARAYAETLAHPVFYKTRAPYVPPPPPPPAAPQVGPPVSVDPGIALGGVAIHGNLKKAYLFSKGGPQGSWVTEGETYMGWKIGSIEPGSTTLQQTGRTLELQLYGRR